MAGVMYFAPAVLLADQTAHAAPIVDPHAPVPFQPAVTQSSAGVPVINIPAPNAQGLSVSQFQSLSAGSEELIFNNSLVAGTSLTGGQVGANPNLAGRAASTILAQVTSTGSQYASVISGPLEIFGNTASLIISNPNGISIPGGTALTNISNLTLTTGTPQFITAAGGTATSYANAGALAYSVNSGNISINGPPGNNGTPGPGIAGTVGNIDLIGQTLAVNAPIQASNRVNLISGNQLVTPTATGFTGTTYDTASNGTTNTASAIGNGGVAIDASQFGSVTSGQVFIVSTAAGMGVNMQGPLAATAGNAVVNANGDITVGQTYASQNVSLTSAGATNITGTALANQNYTVSANGDINATGSVSAGQSASLTAGGNLNATSVAANGSTTLNAGNSMTLGSVSGQSLALQATTGDLTVNSALSAPGTITANAGQDLTINGAVQGGSTVTLTGGHNASVNGAASGVGNTSIAATTGTAQITGDVVTNAALSVSAGQSALIGGNVSALGTLSVTAANGDATLSGTAVTPGEITVQSGGTTTLGGQTQAATASVRGGSVVVNGALTTTGDATLAATNGNLTGTGAIGTTQGNVNLSASGNIAYSGAVQGGAAVSATAAQDVSLANVSAPGTITVQAGRDVNENGSVSGGSTVALSAGRNAAVSGAIAAMGNTTISATTGTATVSGNLQSNGAANVTAGQGVALGGTTQAQGAVTVSAQSGSISGNGNVASSQGAVSLAAGQNIGLTGAVQSGSTVTATAGGNASLGGTLTAPGAIAVSAGGNATLGGSATSGSAFTVTSGGSAAIDGSVASVGDMSLSASGGTLSTGGTVTTAGALNANGQQGVSLGGTVTSGGNAQIGSSAGSVTVAGTLSSPGTIAISAGQDATVSGAVHSGSDTTVGAGGNVALDGGLEADGTGNATVNAGGSLTGSGAVNVANNTTLTAGSNIALTGTIQTGNNLAATAGQNLTVGATTAVGTETLTATNGSATLGNALSGGAMSVTAGMNVNAQGTVQSLGNLAMNANGGNLTANATVSSAGSVTLNAGQSLTLGAQTTVSNDATLTGTIITTQGLAVGGNLSATAINSLDTSAGQLNAAYSASAPTLSVNGNATLNGANVTTANAVIGGTYSATGTANLTTGGTAAYMGNATLAGGTVTNVGTQMAQGTLTVSGSNVTNQGALSSLETMAVTAANLNNSGTIYGPTTNLTVAGTTANTGGLLATNALNLTTANLSNTNGLIFAGDVNHPTAATGDTSVTVTGGNGSYNSTNGQILGQNSVTLNLPNQTIDPSSSVFGTVNGGNVFNLSAQAISNSGTWTLPGTTVNVTASQGISNAGTINQGTGSLTLNGAVTNSGTVNANDLTINGSLANAAGATIQAGDAFTLNGSGTNAGTVEAVNELTISGTSYDNSNGTTQVGNSSSAAGAGNMTVNLSGDLTNAGGTISATNNLTINANNVINSAATSTTTTTSTTTVVNTPLLMSTVIGTETAYGAGSGGGQFGGGLELVTVTQPVTLGGLLATTGEIPANGWNGIASNPDWGGADGFPEGPQSAPVATSGTVTFEQVGTLVAGGSADLWFVQNSDISGAAATRTLTIPTVTETTTTTGSFAASSVIAAGNNLNLTANSLNNQSGTISAGNDANLNVQSLENSGTSITTTVTDAVDSASLTAFMNALASMQASGGISVWGRGNSSGQYGSRSSGYNSGPAAPPASFTFDAVSAIAIPSVSSSVTQQGTTGQIVAGHNVNLSGGSLTNGGNIAAGNDVNITASSFTNQGANTGTMTTTAGCASGYSGCTAGATSNNNSQTYSYQQINANVTAANDVVIAANTVSNTYGNLVAGRNVVIGGAGTTASDTSATPTNLVQAASVTNTSGAIEAGNDVDLNAATLTNTIAAPVQIHQNYGSATPFTSCTLNCEAYVDVQSASPATITANHNVNLTAGTFSNTGSLVTALNNVTINATGSAASSNQYLYAYYRGGYDKNNPASIAFGCAGNTSLCQQLYGSAYVSGDTQNPPGLPDAVGLPDFVPGTIQAGNALSVNSPTLTNTGNVIGQTVSLTGATLVNGLTNPTVYTPPPAVSGQVITLGPPAVPASAATTVNSAGLLTNMAGQPVSVTGTAGPPANLPLGTTTVGRPVAPGSVTVNAPIGAQAGTAQAETANGVGNGTAVQTVGSQTENVTYLVNSPASAVTDDVSPAALLAKLPASLQPDTTQFYYDPYTQAQQVEQAALEETGQSSFYSTTSATDSTGQASINNQDTAALYGAALQYAEQNNIALGTQLSQQQLALVNAPMLWYVEETVPEPGCTATGNASCPTVQALMPEVLLPQNFATVNADGTITGTNVTLNYANSILNTGSISASGTLTVNTGTLTNEQRSTNVGDIYQDVSTGLAATTGTEVQQGGYMTAANYDLNADAINQIGGALEVTNADGSENTAATAQLLTNLKSQLGSSFTQSTVSNDLTTSMVYTNSVGLGGEIAAMVAAVVVSIVTAGGAAAAMSTTLAQMTLGQAMIVAGVSGMSGSLASQFVAGNGINIGSVLEAGAIGVLTAGLTDGITYNSSTGSFGLGNLDQGLNSLPQNTSTLGQLAGISNVGNALTGTVSQAGEATAQSLPEELAALGATATISAGVQTAIAGGSFLTNLESSAASDASAAGAYAIGNEAPTLTADLGPVGGELAYVGLHSALGCAASAAEGTGCGGGAIGGAASAAFSSDFISAIDPTGAPLDSGQQAAVAGFATLLGGGLAGLAGQNVTAGAMAAQNEALNNDTASAAHTAYAAQNGGLGSAALAVAYSLMPWLPGNPATQAIGSGVSSTVQGLISKIRANYGGQTPPADPNNQLSGSNGGGNNTPPTAGAVVTPAPCLAGPGACGMVVSPVVTPGAPILSSGNSGDEGGSTSDQGPSTSTEGLTPFQRGIQFQDDALSALGVPENTDRITVTLPNGSPVTVIPDALDGSTIVEVKDVTNLSNSNQFRGYLATGNPIQLIVSPNTQSISQPLQNLVNSSGGSIRIFNPATGSFSPWISK
ncbi:putative toxin [Paraburkholderia sp. B3]|uniref:two-partner secretion domain-containing protein n=1 Tax=Paraburkholderia sp. B3 TaxID=3134791 RepID=UPI00398205BD